jgi:TonB family protein
VKVISQVDPEYPQSAREAGGEGVVKLRAVVGKDGHVKNVKPVDGKKVMVEAAEQAVMKWIFQPTLLKR